MDNDVRLYMEALIIVAALCFRAAAASVSTNVGSDNRASPSTTVVSENHSKSPSTFTDNASSNVSPSGSNASVIPPWVEGQFNVTEDVSPFSLSIQTTDTSTEERGYEFTTSEIVKNNNASPENIKKATKKKNNHALVGMMTGLGVCAGAGILLCIGWHCLCSRLYAQRQVGPTDLRIPTKAKTAPPNPTMVVPSRDFR